MSSTRRTGPLAAGALLALAGAASAASVDVPFTRITNNGAANPASQFRCVVSDVPGKPGQVTFRFTNSAGIYSSISEIYFEEGGLSSLAAPLFQQGCSFTAGGASPGNLPGGHSLTPRFQANQALSADAGGHPSSGIDASTDFLEMKFNLTGANTFADAVAALGSGALRIGLHVRAIEQPGGGDRSESFVSDNVIPLPPAAYLGGTCLLGMFAVRRWRRT